MGERVVKTAMGAVLRSDVPIELWVTRRRESPVSSIPLLVIKRNPTRTQPQGGNGCTLGITKAKDRR